MKKSVLFLFLCIANDVIYAPIIYKAFSERMFSEAHLLDSKNFWVGDAGAIYQPQFISRLVRLVGLKSLNGVCPLSEINALISSLATYCLFWNGMVLPGLDRFSTALNLSEVSADLTPLFDLGAFLNSIIMLWSPNESDEITSREAISRGLSAELFSFSLQKESFWAEFADEVDHRVASELKIFALLEKFLQAMVKLPDADSSVLDAPDGLSFLVLGGRVFGAEAASFFRLNHQDFPAFFEALAAWHRLTQGGVDLPSENSLRRRKAVF